MRGFRDLPISQKLMLLMTATSVLALLLACGAFVAAEVAATRGRMARALTLRADILGANSAAALTFNDPKAAEETLATLKIDAGVLGARIYAADGRPFASYLRPGAGGLPPSAPAEGQGFTAGRLEAARTLLLDGRPIGTIYVAQDLGEMYRTFALLAGVTLAVLVLCSFVAWALAARFQRLISGPLLRLTETAKAVAERGDYSARASDGSRDELGVLVGAFNEMLRQIQLRDAELERRVAERTAELSAANAELESFSYSVAHDLRAPLRHIHSFSRMVLQDYAGTLDAAGAELLEKVCASSVRMGRLIDDLLTLARLVRCDLRVGEADLSRLAREAADDLREAEPGRAVEFVIADGLRVQGDAVLLATVVQNLLGNAWKYTSKHASARIEFGTARQDGRPVYFVRDDGAGFDMAYAGKLFKPFSRLHSLREFEGSGVGLAAAQRILARHGGRIWCEGEVERGATFYFTLWDKPA